MIVMNRSRLRILPALLAAAVLVSGCGAAGGSSGSKLSVVTSFYPLQYVAQRIAGSHAEVSNLTHAGQEPHDLTLTVRQTAQVADADVVVYLKGFQPAVDDSIDQAGDKHAVDVGSAVHLHAAAEGGTEDGGLDPHFWLDPTRLSAAAGVFEGQLARTDPDHAAAYRRNLGSLRADLARLDSSFRRGLASCRITTLVASHDAFGYLGRRYGIKVVGINGLSPDAEPSPAHIRALQTLIRHDHITTVFSEELASRKFADSLAGDLGIRTAVLDPIEGLTDATADEDYLSLMRKNLATLRKADDCS